MSSRNTCPTDAHMLARINTRGLLTRTESCYHCNYLFSIIHAMRPSKYQNNNAESLMGVQTSYMLLDWTNLFFNFQENWQTLVFTMFQVWKCNVHNTQQWRGGGSIFHRGVHISQENMDPRVHIPLLIMDPGSIFRGSIFNMTPAHPPYN